MLRKGVRFSDGTPFDASAVKTWIDWLNTGVAFIDNNTPGVLGPLRSVDVLSKYVVRIRVKLPNPDLAWALSGVVSAT